MVAPARSIARECLALRARRLDRVVSRIYDEALRPLGLRTTQLNVLTAVALGGPIAPARIAEHLDLEKSSLSRNVQRMEERGWLRVAQADDGRGSRLTVTPAGRRLLEDARAPWREAQRRVRALLGDDIAEALWATDAVLDS